MYQKRHLEKNGSPRKNQQTRDGKGATLEQNRLVPSLRDAAREEILHDCVNVMTGNIVARVFKKQKQNSVAVACHMAAALPLDGS